jgi:CRISPR/Cas system-associated protein Cas7 (RAMP superfamily)
MGLSTGNERVGVREGEEEEEEENEEEKRRRRMHSLLTEHN